MLVHVQYFRSATFIRGSAECVYCSVYIWHFPTLQICSTLSDLDSFKRGSAAVACLLVREGADLYCKGGIGKSPVEFCSKELSVHLNKYKGERYVGGHMWQVFNFGYTV